MTPLSIEADRSAHLIIGELLNLRPGENLAIICDNHSAFEMAYALAAQAQIRGAEYTILHQPSREPTRKNELTAVVEAALEKADAMIGLTATSGGPSYSSVVKRLLDEKRLRVISMVMRDMEIFTKGGALANYAELLEEGKQLAKIWQGARTMRITSEAGTDISSPIANDYVIVECGYANEPGMEAAFSDGEVSSRPIEGKAEGVFVIDGPGTIIGTPSAPISVTVENGRVKDICCDSPEATQLMRIVQSVKNADNIAEFGIGLNPASIRNGRFQEEKKARGLVHIALGDNIFYGGTTQSMAHMDMVLYNTTVHLDDRTIVQNGNLLSLDS